MNWVDAVIIAAFFSAAFLGFKIGVLRTAIMSGTFILATVAGARGSVMFSALLERHFDDPNLAYVIGFMAAFSLAFAGLLFIGMAIYKVVSLTPLAWVDRWIGSILGALAGVVLLGLAIVYLTTFPTANSEEWLNGSSITPIVRAFMSPIFRELLRGGNAAVVVALCGTIGLLGPTQ